MKDSTLDWATIILGAHGCDIDYHGRIGNALAVASKARKARNNAVSLLAPEKEKVRDMTTMSNLCTSLAYQNKFEAATASQIERFTWKNRSWEAITETSGSV